MKLSKKYIDLLKLPAEYPKKTPFLEYVEKKLDDYIDLLEEIHDNSPIKRGPLHVTRTIIDRQEKFIDELIFSLEDYLEGRPSKSYKTFSGALETRLNEYNNEKALRLFAFKEFEEKSDFYRMRKIDSVSDIDSLDLFHVPFEKRGLASTTRFSIPGFPSLYLSSSIYVSWKEMGKPNLKDTQIIKLKNNFNLNLLDLSYKKFNGIQSSADYKYLISWPLIFLCSIKVQNREDNFKPEYIISQMLLEFIRNYMLVDKNIKIDGILYSSTHVEPEINYSEKAGSYNFVLPVKATAKEGYCEHLLQTFRLSNPISFDKMVYSHGDLYKYSGVSNRLKIIDDRLPKVELINGLPNNYSSTAFGQMELYFENFMR